MTALPHHAVALSGPVEVIARAMAGEQWDHVVENATLDIKSYWRAKARVALSALEGEGMVVVPVVPTLEMIEASNREWDGRMSHRSSGAWQAMVAARPR